MLAAVFLAIAAIDANPGPVWATLTVSASAMDSIEERWTFGLRREGRRRVLAVTIQSRNLAQSDAATIWRADTASCPALRPRLRMLARVVDEPPPSIMPPTDSRAYRLSLTARSGVVQIRGPREVADDGIGPLAQWAGQTRDLIAGCSP
jgi:hypothetical protein